MSDESFAAIDAMLHQEVHLVSTLSEENARLRAALLEHGHTHAHAAQGDVEAPPPRLDAAELVAELRATKRRQDEMAREMDELRLAHTTVATAAKEDQSSEVALLRQSLANLAEQLEREKARVTDLESKRRDEEDKVAILRSKVEDSRRALMRLQGESTKRAAAAGADASSSSSSGATGPPTGGVFSFPPRRASFLDPSTRRRSSLGLASISGSPSLEEPPPSVVGLGLGVEAPTTTTTTHLSAPTSTPFARFAHRRGSASLSHVPDDDDRTARLRDLRLGVISTKISSRRNSAISGVPEFLGPDDFILNLSGSGGGGRRMSSVSRRQRNSICEQDEDRDDAESGPPSAGLRLRGRRESAAVFEQFSRRSSGSEATFQTSSTSSQSCGYSSGSTVEELKLELEGLRIQLAESEEGRRASELCLQALKEFISKSDSNAPEAVSLPPMPSDPTMDGLERDDGATATATMATSSRFSSGSGSASTLPRWSIPRLSIGSRRDSTQSNASVSSSCSRSHHHARRASGSSQLSTSTLAQHDRSTPSLPSFGGFSFSALVSRSSSAPVSGDASPTAPACPLFPSPLAPAHHDDDDDDARCEPETFPVDPSPLLASSSASDHDHDHDDAPSLVSDLSSSSASESAISPASSRAASPSPRASEAGLAIAVVDDDSPSGAILHARIDVEKRSGEGPQLVVDPSALPLLL
ncbi:hypothetical protein JCM11491_005099 [Sporobolomyces phaffii]